MKLAINIDTSDKASRDQLIKMAITIHRFDKKTKPSEDAAMANKIIDILEGK